MSGAIRKGLLLALCALAHQVVEARVANKTYFSARNELQHNGRLWAAKAPYKGMNKGERGLVTEVIAFGSKSKNDYSLGRYFGSALKADFSDANNVVTIGSSTAGLSNGLFDRQVDHTWDAGNGSSMAGKMKLNPVQKRIGAYLTARADLGSLFNFEGWHLNAELPIVRITNTIGVTYPVDTAAIAGSAKAATSKSTLAHLFDGTYSQGGKNSQQSLQYGKVSAADDVNTGTADMKFTVAYDVARDTDGMVQVRGGVIVPLGSKPTAENMFEAVRGNGGHVGIVAGIHGDIMVWENKAKKMALLVSGDAEYTFLFEAREKRIAGVYNVGADATVPWGHMGLGVQLNNAGTFPLANVLARDMKVTPGSHFDGVLGFSFLWKDFYVNGGYNLFYRKTETVDFADQWPVDRYGMATYVYQGTTAATDFSATSFTDAGKAAVGPLNERFNVASHLNPTASVAYQADTLVCTCPNQETHSALLGLGYRSMIRSIPFDISVSGSYELALDPTKAINGWSVGAKVTLYL